LRIIEDQSASESDFRANLETADECGNKGTVHKLKLTLKLPFWPLLKEKETSARPPPTSTNAAKKMRQL